jgi:photosystem II stability/assembly factor-like uncharacterized protein
MLKKLLLFPIFCLLFCSALHAQDFWQEMAAFEGGVINDASVAENGDIYVASNGAGVFKSTDNGETWQRKTNGLLDWEIAVVHASRSGKIYAASFENGIFVSTDGGESWSYPDFNFDMTSFFHATDFLDHGDYIYMTSEGGIFRSENDGKTWEEIKEGFTSHYPHCNCIEADDKGHLYLGTNGGLYKSTNQGDQWFKLAESLVGSWIEDILFNKGRIITASRSKGVFYTDDGGQTYYESHPNPGVFVPLALGIDHKGVIYTAGASGIYYSTDNSESWTKGKFPDESALHLIMINDIETAHDGRLLFSTDSEGFWAADEKCSEWNYLSKGMNSISVESILAASDGSIYAGLDGQAVYISTDRGESWQWHNNSLAIPSRVNCLYESHDGRVFACADYDLYVEKPDETTDYTWQELQGDHTEKLSFAADKQNNMYLGSVQGIMRSTDNGKSWQKSQNGIIYQPLRTNAVLVDNFGDVYVGIKYYGVYRSTNQGKRWLEMTNGMEGYSQSITALAADSENNLYAGTTASGLFMFPHSGERWEKIDKGFENLYIKSIVISPAEEIFAATLKGVYHSTNRGESWNSLTAGMDIKRVLGLTIDNHGYIWAATPGKIYRSRSIINSAKSPKSDEIAIYPNPASEQVNITGLPAGCSIELVNPLGEKILTQNDITRNNQSLNLSGIPAGGYFLLVKSNSNNYIEYLVIVK